MGEYVASQVIKLMIDKDIKIKKAEVLLLGITFKENCPDVRNTKVVDVVKGLKEYNTDVTIYDPWADVEEVQKEYNLYSVKELPKGKYDAVVLAVAHDEYKDLDLKSILKDGGVVYDVKGVLPKGIADKTL